MKILDTVITWQMLVGIVVLFIMFEFGIDKKLDIPWFAVGFFFFMTIFGNLDKRIKRLEGGGNTHK